MKATPGVEGERFGGSVRSPAALRGHQEAVARVMIASSYCVLDEGKRTVIDVP